MIFHAISINVNIHIFFSNSSGNPTSLSRVYNYSVISVIIWLTLSFCTQEDPLFKKATLWSDWWSNLQTGSAPMCVSAALWVARVPAGFWLSACQDRCKLMCCWNRMLVTALQARHTSCLIPPRWLWLSKWFSALFWETGTIPQCVLRSWRKSLTGIGHNLITPGFGLGCTLESHHRLFCMSFPFFCFAFLWLENIIEDIQYVQNM